MDTSWWPAVAAVVAVALVVLFFGGRVLRSAPAGRGAVHGPGPPPRPRAGEIWWTAQDRPCVVLSVRGRVARVAPITGKYHDDRPGVIPLPPGVVGEVHGRPGFVEADRAQEVSVWEFRRRAGVLDPAVWDEVKGLGGGGGR
ncbi:type II toxin-antitoxin system PemK/MazF family toxin [Streptomyces bambusae]|uniref:Type II toxin-antitoxin system PemK/MazF family toxin n=1 Tax=Streptomyces bambusae TaxID=1550616 RepID=A0ABS6Z3E8_9ACTN|nr:type II toxin-antitoxin system PemK/MazF family toxin [Streptomyces bambusae]MBW5482276.1 hypothetical protein [Streptomyces bambusae]